MLLACPEAILDPLLQWRQLRLQVSPQISSLWREELFGPAEGGLLTSSSYLLNGAAQIPKIKLKETAQRGFELLKIAFVLCLCGFEGLGGLILTDLASD